MHLHTILAFAFLFWRVEAPLEWSLLPKGSVTGTLAIVLGQPIALTLIATLCVRKSRRLLSRQSEPSEAAIRFYHRSLFILRLALVAGFGGSTLLTDWPDWFAFGRVAPSLQIFGDLIVLTPYFVGCLALWLATFPLEGALHGADMAPSKPGETASGCSWRLSSYLDFHIRHHLLVISAPMMLILFASNLTRGYETALRRWSNWFWTPDALLGVVAAGVFLIAPFLLRRLWRTSPLASGPLRERLEALCTRIGLRCREILVWQSDGLMLNAAVMGIVPAARYVLLSDALLAAMSPRQIEAVFGHEAGHVRHRHIQHFLVFAFVGWLGAGALMELLGWLFVHGNAWSKTGVAAIQGTGLALTFIFWVIGFGWLSRRFERQADLFGARCVTPDAANCNLPCSVHLNGAANPPESERVCAAAAAVFASALDRVAVLSGIPHEERSWRHSSVGSRIRFLHSAAGDPALAVRFERVIRRAKAALLAAAIVGSAGALYYWSVTPTPALMRMRVGRAEAQGGYSLVADSLENPARQPLDADRADGL